jgi:hypothetical protein
MSSTPSTALLLGTAIAVAAACAKSLHPRRSDEAAVPSVNRSNTMTTTKLQIRVGAQVFSASLYDNPAATRFAAMLPLTLDMSELNGNEKFFRLAKDLPTNAANPGTIEAGDLMLWGSNTVVVFYKTFATSYAYTKLGRIDAAEGLAKALGTGDAKVVFELARAGKEPRR